MITYKSNRIIDGKPRWIIVNEKGNIINKSPKKEELKNVKSKEECKSRSTDEELLDLLIQFYEETGNIPTTHDFEKNCKYPHYDTYRNHFGSRNSALKMAGLNINIYTNTTDNELLNYLKKFYEETGNIPTKQDFVNDNRYPSVRPYITRFGSWTNALKISGIDIDVIIKKGVTNNYQKGRLFELQLNDFLGEEAIDLSGIIHHSPYDGICPNGDTYEAKSCSCLGNFGWSFGVINSFKKGIKWFYLGGFDIDYNFYIGINYAKFNVENMREYEITDKFKEVISNYDIN